MMIYHFSDLQIECFAVGKFNVFCRTEGSQIEYLTFSYIDFVAGQVVVATFVEDFLLGYLCTGISARRKNAKFIYILYVDSFFAK